MRIRKAYALLLGMVGIASTTHCSSDPTETGGKTDSPTEVTVTWTFSGKPASAEECMARGGVQVYVNLSGTIDPSLHQTLTSDCATGTVKFTAASVEKLGKPYLEGALINDKQVAITRVGDFVTPMTGATSVTLDFFPIVMDGGQGGASSSSSSGKGPVSSAVSSSAVSSSASSSAVSSSASSGP